VRCRSALGYRQIDGITKSIEMFLMSAHLHACIRIFSDYFELYTARLTKRSRSFPLSSQCGHITVPCLLRNVTLL
jgi:hypothetical protein